MALLEFWEEAAVYYHPYWGQVFANILYIKDRHSYHVLQSLVLKPRAQYFSSHCHCCLKLDDISEAWIWHAWCTYVGDLSLTSSSNFLVMTIRTTMYKMNSMLFSVTPWACIQESAHWSHGKQKPMTVTMWEVTTHSSDINNNMFPIFNINGIKMVSL